MKTHKEEAEALVEKYYQNSPELFGTGKAMEHAVKCAIIAVEAIIEETRHYQDLVSVWQKDRDYTVIERITYWKKVLNHLKQM